VRTLNALIYSMHRFFTDDMIYARKLSTLVDQNRLSERFTFGALPFKCSRRVVSLVRRPPGEGWGQFSSRSA